MNMNWQQRQMIKERQARQRPYSDWANFGVVNNYDKRITKAIGSVSRWGNYKSLDAVCASIIDTLYTAGKDLFLSPKDMVNNTTRKAYAIETGKLVIERRSVRDQVSCGHDEYNGRCQHHRWVCMTNENSNQYYQRYDDSKTRRFLRFDSHEEATASANEFMLEWAEDTYAKYKDVEAKESQPNLSTFIYRLKRCFDEEGNCMIDNVRRHFGYNLIDDVYKYKGECAWADDPNKPCLHHDGEQWENVVGYYSVDENGEKVWEYLDQWDDEAEFIKTLVKDEDVLKCIKWHVPKMKTESRDWIKSTWRESKYNLKDPSQPNTWKNRDYYYVNHGKRGYYQLTWWATFQQQEERENKAVVLKEKDGLEVNGWVFKAHGAYTPTSGEWRPISKEGIVVYTVGKYTFRTFDMANQFRDVLVNYRKSMIGVVKSSDRYGSTGYSTISRAHGLTTDFKVQTKSVDFALAEDANPSKHTPQEAFRLHLSGTLKEPLEEYVVRFNDEWKPQEMIE